MLSAPKGGLYLDNRHDNETVQNQSSRVSKPKKTRKEKRQLKKQRKKDRRKRRHPVLRVTYFMGRLMRRMVLVGLLTASIGLVAGIVYYQGHIEPMVSQYIKEGYEISETISASHFESLEPTIMTDKNGEVIREFRDRNYVHVDLQEDDALYQRVSDVTTTIEDARFYNHHGFDYLGLSVAVFDYAARGTDLRGASTLTQQLVKNKYLSQDQTVERKISEAVIAQELETQFTKREILEFYVNEVYFGRGNHGIGTAAHYYFGKPTEELGYKELATLISIPNNPTIYDPINNPENTLRRRNLVLRLLAENNTLSQEEADALRDEPLDLDITPMRIDNSVDDWAESFAMNQAVESLMRWEGFNFEYWHETNEARQDYRERYNNTYSRHMQNILRGGFVIETSIDRKMQTALQTHIDHEMRHFTASDADGLLTKQAPSVVIDNRSNEVVAIVGGRTQEGNTSFNRAFQSARQPGSAIKPFLSFAPAFERGLATGTVREDKPIKDGPGNYYSGYRGNMTLKDAMAHSVNTIAYNLLLENGIATSREKLELMEFNQLRPEDRYPTMAIGGWTQGASPLELAAAFNTLVNDGEFHRPSNLRVVRSTQHDTVYYDRTEDVPTRVYESGVGYVTLNTLQSATTDGTGTRYSFDYEYEAGKTGTTNDVRELWFVGGTPYYSMSLYIGDNNPGRQERATVDPVIQSIYREFMRQLHDGKDVIDFNRPSTVVEYNGNMWVRTTKDDDPMVIRRQTELKRQAESKAKQSARVQALAYRIEHGLTLQQAEAREKVAVSRIETLESYKLGNSEDATDAQKLKALADEAIENVVRPNVSSELVLRANSAYQAIERQRQANISDREQREREEQEQEERLIREEQERRLQEEEDERKRLEKEQLEKEREEEEARLAEEEKRRQEEERLSMEQKQAEEDERRKQDEQKDVGHDLDDLDDTTVESDEASLSEELESDEMDDEENEDW